jgi:hypothetical protein
MTSKRAIFASDIRGVGGVVTVASGRSPFECEEFFRVAHVSKGGDVLFQSRPISDEDQAAAAARVLTELTGASVKPSRRANWVRFSTVFKGFCASVATRGVG